MIVKKFHLCLHKDYFFLYLYVLPLRLQLHFSQSSANVVVFVHVTSKANLTYKDFTINPRHLHTYIKKWKIIKTYLLHLLCVSRVSFYILEK